MSRKVMIFALIAVLAVGALAVTLERAPVSGGKTKPRPLRYCGTG